MKVASVCATLFVVIGLNDRASAQIPEGYEVVVLANDLGIHSRPEINNRSEVVWAAAFPPDVSDVWMYSAGVIRKISDDTGYDIDPALNDVGLVIGRRCPSYFDFDCGLVAYQGGAVLDIPIPVTYDQTGGVNNEGVIFWAHDFSGTFDHVELFRTVGGKTEQFTDSGFANQGARTNSHGDVVWIEYNFFVSPWRSKVMLWLAGERQPIELTDGMGAPQGVDINDARQIVWGVGNGGGITLLQGGKGTLITDDGRAPRISNSGSITFARWNEDAGVHRQMLLTDERSYELPSALGWSGGTGTVNEIDEVAWREIDPDVGISRIMMLRVVGIPGDFNLDCHVDMEDLRAMQLCFTSTAGGPPGGLLGACTRGDFDGDGDVDLDDFASFDEAFTGPEMLVPSCVM